ncbi:MAG TPA: AAA family ATPase [Thermoanaerobaculia bacterium]|nr:AAA family ATPase [Thermoanaerobaculia bacterium]
MSLFLDSLQIENYRGFRNLCIERLGRANLFVGRNNTGKSSILEAVRLLASRGSEEVLWAILESHDEIRAGTSHPENRLYAIRQLVHGRKWFDAEIRIGAMDDPRKSLAIKIRDEEIVTTVGNSQRHLSLETEARTRDITSLETKLRQAYVPPEGLTAETSARLWDLITLTDLEQSVIEALRIISPDIERISFIGEHGQARIPMAKLANQARPIPLRSLGDGVGRMLGIALSLVSARGGVLLLDEVENGIHFTAQEQLWQLIFRLAHELNTQVFATSHSWDCIEAFQQAAALDPNEEAVLVRLDVHRDAITPTSFSERDLSIVTRDQIEVR